MQKGGNIRKYDTKYRLEEFVLRLKKLKKYYSIIRAPIVLITGQGGYWKIAFYRTLRVEAHGKRRDKCANIRKLA